MNIIKLSTITSEYHQNQVCYLALRILIFTFINISTIKIIEAFESDNIRFDQLDNRNSRNNR
jgi:hypothetical protein